jgi:hypothetical protein
VADDRHVDYFLVRDADWRLSDREAAAVTEWTRAADSGGPDSGVVHCVRDHPRHAGRALVDGLWGGRPTAIRHRLKRDLVWFTTNSLELTGPGLNVTRAMRLLDDVVWPAMAELGYCHDSVSDCDRWPPRSARHAFPTGRQGGEYVGQKYTEHHELVSNETVGINDVVCRGRCRTGDCLARLDIPVHPGA